MADKPQKFMSQPLRARRDYSAAGPTDDDEDKTELEYDRYGSPKGESVVVTPAEKKVTPEEEPDYDSYGRGQSPGMSCPFCGKKHGLDPKLLESDIILVCSSCKCEVPTKTIRKTAGGYRAD